MRTTITTRHCEIADALRDRAQLVMDRLVALSDRAAEPTVIFDVEAGLHQVELRLQAAGGKVLVATAEGPDHRKALDRAEGKLRRQLVRTVSKTRARRHSGSAPA
ncbi:MAG: HPF/RaiA family ribosome-associated protein [Gemmatimonadales bacterium]|nr:HPF/RaiA family ribosome-associated protein [Gemmatimonadales bacterium]